MGGMLSRPGTDFDANPRRGTAAKARHAPRWAWGLLALTVLLAGCLKFKRVEGEQSISLKAKDVQGVLTTQDPQPKDMDVTVTATTSPPTPVTLYLVATDDEGPAMEELSTSRKSSKVIAESTQSESPTLQGTAPAGKLYTVIAVNGGNQTTEVKAKLVGKY